MNNRILITDSLFIFDKHVELFKKAGYEIERLDKSQATEEELCKAVEGKVGYLMGGIEYVTAPVIEHGQALKALIFAGSDWKKHIPAHELATSRGIAIANSPGSYSDVVAEYSLLLVLAMLRKIFDVGPTGKSTFLTTRSIIDQSVGVIGMGLTARDLCRMLKGMGVKDLNYANRTRYPDVESEYGIKKLELTDLLKTCDVVFMLVSSDAGTYMDAASLRLLKDGAVLINTSYEDALDLDAAYVEVRKGRISIAQDGPADERFKSVPLSNWYNSNEPTAYNTQYGTQKTSDMATESMINLLTNGQDQYMVNV